MGWQDHCLSIDAGRGCYIYLNDIKVEPDEVSGLQCEWEDNSEEVKCRRKGLRFKAPYEKNHVAAYIVMVYIVMAYIVMTYIVMAYIVVAYMSRGKPSRLKRAITI